MGTGGLVAQSRLVGQVALVQKRQLALDVHVSVQDDVAVRQVVVARVRVEELAVGELRDGARVAARLAGVGGCGEQRAVHRVVKHTHGIGERTLHLVEHHAVVAQGAVFELLARFDVELVVPALLLKDGWLGVDGRIEHGVHIDVHEVEQVLFVGARHRVYRLVRVRHGVEERLHGALDEVDEGLLHGELGRPAQNGVLEDVEHAGVVGRGRFEGDGERLVLVLAGKVEQARAGGGVVQHVGVGVEFGQGLARRDGESREVGAGGEEPRGARACGGLVFAWVGEGLCLS